MLENITSDQAGLICILTVAAFFFIKLNLWYWSARRKMTPEERKREDEDSEPW